MKKINTYSVKNWSDIPTVWKNTKEVKKVKYTNSPFDKELLNMLSPIAGDDSLRPVMNGVNFDDFGITVTNAHVLVNIPEPNEKYKGTYATIPKRDYTVDKNSGVEIKNNMFISPKYPQYKEIIRGSKKSDRVQKINVYKLLQWTEVALKYCNKGSFTVFYWMGDTSMAFNANFIIDSMKLLLKLGYSEVYCFTSEGNKAAIFSPDKDYELGKSLILLLMPVMIDDKIYKIEDIKGGSFDLDFSRELLTYYDFSTDEIRDYNDSVAEFKMFYGDYDVLPENEIKMLNKFSEKNTVPILDYFSVRNGEIHVNNTESAITIKETDLQDGLYDVLDGAIEHNTSMDLDEYPYFYELRESKIKFIISSDILKYYLDLSLKYVANDEFRPQFNGILFEYKDNKMYIVATNAHILSKIDVTKYIEINEGQYDFKFIINKDNLIKFFKNIEPSAITVSASDKYVSFENNDYIFSSRLIDAKYPNYEGVISYFNDKKLTLSKTELLNCINSDEAKKFIKEHKKQQIIIFDEYDSDGRLNIYVGVTDSWRNEKNSPISEKVKVGNVSYSSEEGTYQIMDGNLLIMPMSIETINKFAFDVKYLESILESLNCDSFDFLYKETNKGYFITGKCLDYGSEIKPISEYKKVKKVSKKDADIEELETLIELLKEVVAENPKDLDSKDALDLYEETLVELKKVNAEKFEKGGRVGCGCKHSFAKGGEIEIKKDGTLSSGDHIQYEVDIHGINPKFNHKLYGTIEKIDDNEYYATYLNEIHFENEQEKEFSSFESAEKWVLSKINKDKDYYIKEFGDKFAKGGEIKTKKVIRRNLPINKEYKLVDSFYTGGIMENPMSCENCGRPIANVAVIEDEDGRKYDVGMDCAETLSQIKNSLEFNMAQNDFAEANAIRTKVKNALKKYPDAKLTIDNTYYGTVNIHVRNDRGIYVNSNLPKEFAFKYLPEFKNKISNPEKNGYVPRYKDNIKLDLDLASFKDKNAATKEVKLDDYKVVISREDRPNYNTETGEIRNYNNYIIVKVFKGEELIGERSFYMASDIVPKITSIINEYDFENFKEQFKYGGYIQSLSYSEILKRLKDEFGIDESDGKTIHSSDLMRIIQLDKNIDPNAGMNLAKVLTDNGWTIIRDKYEQGGLLESNGTKYFSKDFESKGNTWNILFVWGKFNYVSVSKKTNNPFRSGVGKEFKNVDEAIAYYKNPDMKVQLIFAENEAKELGYMSAFQNGGKLPESFIEKTYGDLHEEKGIITTKSNWLDKDGIKRLQYGFDPFRDEDYNTLFYYSWDFRDSGLSYDEFRNKLKDFFSSKYGKTVNKLTSLYVGWDRKEKGTYEKGGEISENELYYAVYDDNTLGLLFLDERGNKRFLVLQGSTLRGSNYSHMSMPLYINEDELSKIRKATEKDFDIYRVSLPPDFNKLNSQENLKGMIKKGDIVLFKCEGSETECRGEILDTLSKGEYLVSKGIKAVIVPKEKVIGIAPTKINTIFEKDFSLYDERVMAINSTLFHKTYGIGENPFEVNYDESNEYGYGIYFLDEKYSGVGKYKESRILSIKPNVKKPLIFLNDDGSSFNSNYKEAYDNAVKYDGVTSKDDFNKKMIEQGYDSMVISDIHGIHLIFFYNDPKLYEVKSDKGN